MSQQMMKISEIVVGERFRKDFGDLEGLADSIKQKGLLQPIVVDDANNLVAGERRLKACRSLRWDEVPVVRLGELDEVGRREIELEENVRRKQLTWVEEVKAVAELHRMKQERYGVVTPATRVGPAGKSGWGIRDTADSLGMPASSLSVALRLADGIERFLDIAKAKTRGEAYKSLLRLEREGVEKLLSKYGVQERGAKPTKKRVDPRELRVYLRDRCVCQYCGLDGTSDFRIFENLCIDHLVPTARGGPDAADNMVIACRNCNEVKGDYDPRKDAPPESREALLTAARKHVRNRLDAKRTYFEEVLATLKEQVDNESRAGPP